MSQEWKTKARFFKEKFIKQMSSFIVYIYFYTSTLVTVTCESQVKRNVFFTVVY